MPTLDRTMIASPPDDGGHMGAFSPPGDEAMVPDGEPGSMPPLSTDATRTHTIDRDESPHHRVGWIGGTLLLAAISAAAVALVSLLAG